MNTRKLFRGLGVSGLMIALGACQGVEQGETTNDDSAEANAPGAELAFADLEVVAADEAGVPTFANAAFGQLDAGAGARTHEEEDAAVRPTLARLRPLFRLNTDELSFKNAFTDNIGDRHFVYTQKKNGLEVLGGALVLHSRRGAVYAVHGEARGDLEAPIDAQISGEDAVLSAKKDASLLSDVEAEAIPRMAYRRAGNKLELVYLVKVTGMRRDGLPVDDDVFVSAADGKVVDRNSHVHSARYREVHDAQHGASLPGPLERAEGWYWPSFDSVINNSYDNLGTVYNCYQQLFGRDSYNNGGAALVSTVHYWTNYNNAFWNGTQMVYGDGDGVNFSNFANSLDVTAHELTHAVTGSSSQLVYSGQSGGLNESMSDIFGEVCEWFRDGQVVSGNTWKVGEDCYTPGIGGDALRYMNDPRADGASIDFLADYSASDKDPHHTSGISNLAFYLLSQGGTHPRGRSSQWVNGIGIAKAAQIFYRANTVTLVGKPNATFSEARVATEQAAAQLGYSSSDIASVTAAWFAVGVGGFSPVCDHDRCTTGGALNGGCHWCVANICQVDPYCCNTYWDSICVGEVQSVCNSLNCAASQGSCSHTVCSGGAPLANGCSSCTSSICAVDPYCCNTYWDSICVSEVNSVCGKNCG